MRCEKIKHKLNDLLDRTLPTGEEQEVLAHLADCPACRGEFQLVKNADELLRETVLEMVAEIEVPANLSQRIGQALAGEKNRKPGTAKLFGLFQAPAFAAAMLVLVAATGLFGYYKLFAPSPESPALVLSVPQSHSSTESTGNTNTDPAPLSDTGQEQSTVKDVLTTDAPYKAASPLVTERAPESGGATITMQDADTLDAESLARQNAPPGRGGGDSFNAQENGAADLAQAAGTEDEMIPMSGGQSSGAAKLSISSRAALRQGTLQEAAREVGFTPTVPGYLPPETEITKITWGPGTVYQEYQSDRNSFMLTQSRVAGVGVTGDKSSQLIDLNGAKANLQETSPGGDPSWVYTTVSWQRDEWVFTVEGELPRAEILKIALSIE